jgi:NADPH-dependent ferric siderophore reductase
LHVHDQTALSLLYAPIPPFRKFWYIGSDDTALACIAARLDELKRKRGQVVTGVGDGVKVTVEVAVTDPLAFEVAVRVTVSAVAS